MDKFIQKHFAALQEYKKIQGRSVAVYESTIEKYRDKITGKEMISERPGEEHKAELLIKYSNEMNALRQQIIDAELSAENTEESIKDMIYRAVTKL